MIRSSFICLLLSCVICSFCEKDFVSLGRHEWRCNNKINDRNSNAYSNGTNHSASHGINAEPVITPPTTAAVKKSGTKCCCGKVCKGARGLKMHQRSCQVTMGLNKELLENVFEQEESNNNCAGDLDDIDTTSVYNTNQEEEYPELKNGINLPKTSSEWLTANEHFKFSLMSNPPVTSDDLNTSIKLLNDTIYTYFAGNFGFVERLPDKLLNDKYKNHSIKDLKKALKLLKQSSILKAGRIDSLQFMIFFTYPQKLRSKYLSWLNDSLCMLYLVVLDLSLFRTRRETYLISARSELDNLKYFKTVLTKVNPNKIFQIPSSIPMLHDPIIEFDLEPPTYRQITNIIRKMKTSGSPCPLDQISIISFKRCPYLRTYLTELIQAVWLSGSVPDEWKKACTILIHKKNDANLPENFRPITLQSVPLKVFTSSLRNAMFSYLLANNFIEHEIQKGFTPHISGTFEHTAQMAYIINQARIRQRSLVITLLDLKNAFGEVHHNLIQSVLGYHHIPQHIQLMIKSLYTNFKTSIITSDFNTPFVEVGRGVLQGDCLSPLLFNLCFNTFIQPIKSEKYQQFGFSYKLLNPIHWFQFADDAAVITGQESENQHLLNRFAIWCQWSDMIIRVDKCSNFGIKKALTNSIQYLPKLIINKSIIPTVESGKSFCYLGRYFDYEMTNNEHKSELVSLLTDLMKEIDSKPLHPKNKILLYSRYVLSKLSWHFTITSIQKTWISENLDSVFKQYIRKWLEVPISGSLSNIYLTSNKFGLNIIPPSTKFIQCQTTIRSALKSSPNESITHLWKSTCNHTNTQYDQYTSTKEVIKSFREVHEDKLENRLKCQGSFLSSISKFLLPPSKFDLANLSIQTTKKHFQLHYSLHKQFATNP
ncbi:Hypothetical predicted protein [Paramuricea clavata]|uniref:Uncharacterized protein n=1 Tax=Paramuricea clavata TaxID=317549 RepID=A0A6S7G878_PARCT|nr:Hypothetical predicted protein [Paramuricea clavata]